MAKKVILWSAARCLSTVFYRSITTLKKTKSFQELFSMAYYLGPEHLNDMWLPLLDRQYDFTYDDAIKLLLADYPGMDLVFAKEHAFSLPETMYEDMVKGGFSTFIHTFLIRDPERALYSNYKVIRDNYSSIQSLLDPPSGGLYELYKFYNFIKWKKGATPIVVDAADLQAHPDEIMKCYCEAVGICFDQKMMTWEPATCPNQYDIWAPFNTVINQSSGFIKVTPDQQKPVPLHELPAEVMTHIENNRPQYKEMLQDCIKPVVN